MVSDVAKNRTKKRYLHGDVILTFDTPGKFGDSQEFFNSSLPINRREVSAMDFLSKKLFPRIVKKCDQLNRKVGDLIKIDMCSSHWPLFEEVTKLDSIFSHRQTTKWYFGKGRCDLDEWEKELMKSHSFGMEADMSYMDEAWYAAMRAQISDHENSKNNQITLTT